MQLDTATPVGERERIHALDALRGIALLGILVVNMSSFKGLSTLEQFPRLESLAQPIDAATFLLIQGLFSGKFYPIFAFLFGLGFGLQMKRLQARTLNPTRVMLRRLATLLIIGALHGLFIWTGDVLFLYAITGMVLLLFRNVRPSVILGWVIGLWGLQAFLCLSCGGLTLWWASVGNVDESGQAGFFAEYIEQGRRTYAQGGYWEAQQFRFIEWLLMLTNALFFAPDVLIMFLLGLYFSKIGVFEQLEAHRRLLGWLAVAGLLLGLASNALIATGLMSALRAKNELLQYGWLTLSIVVGPLLALGYIGMFGLLWTSLPALQRLLTPVAAAGRMALTNYLMQSVVCTLLFYGYGFGLHGKVSIAEGLALSVLIWAVQVALSVLWLSRFQYGPMEWLWRTLTYGQRIALRRS
ncbi:MAG: hypothetical protein CFK49_10555 [Armatimonadetes bacterium JP3_11]|nr:MAG: hypothetical protein CFK49_10555 [Armatimonadetes bacterium JP3_11]